MLDPAVDPAAYPKVRTCPFAHEPEYARLRAEAPITKVPMAGGGTAWLVTRHDLVRQVLGDPRMSSDRRRPGFPRLSANQRPIPSVAPLLVGMDPPEHTEARRAVLAEFTVRRIEKMRPRIQQIVDGCIDDMLAETGPVDLVRALSLPVPSLVICELLGVPYADHDFFQERSSLMLRKSTPVEQRAHAVEELQSYLDRLVTGKEREITDDLLGRQIRKQREIGEVDHHALVALAFLLLIAGHETTANMISLGTLALLVNPQLLAEIVADPTKTPSAVEELLRYFTIVEAATSRVALEDVEIGGVLIRAGEGVVALGTSANRDPDAFDQPEEIDINRSARRHVAFGFGPHQCLGQNLARLELQIVFDTLFRRLPGLRLDAAIDDLPFKSDANVYGIYEMPVTW
ncbi:cytochrome P450 [Saccharopolyspora phatthalungensis]|uniref:Cytochrome P450 n=1 Tax=Saccharopolyspora phatthalungensis TaxID=664693 RepID=A0A840QHJ3_9PSEU|nr:cytochrome P450 [Saccharopolyspora phatthalungensis]MBB5158119.1 cytochrome P450 [Saccharopolyspora phatthalungensis]